MRASPYILALAAMMLAGCGHLPITLTVGDQPHQTGSPACAALESFFRASIHDEWGGGASFLGDGVEAHRTKIVKYMELTEDDSKRQMALSASACEQFEARQISPAQYADLLDKALGSSADAQAFNGQDFQAWLDRFQGSLKTYGDAAAATNGDVRKLLADVLARVQKLQAEAPDIAARARAARADPDKAATLASSVSQRGDEIENQLLAQTPEAVRFESDTTVALTRIDNRLLTLEQRLASQGGPLGDPGNHGQTQPPGGPVLTDLNGSGDQTVIRQIDTLEISRSTKVFFATGDAGVRQPYAVELTRLVSTPTGRGARLVATVVGFADEAGGVELNDRLALARAEAVAAILKANGVNQVQVQSKGATTTFGPSRQMNRVVLVELTGSTTSAQTP